MPIIEIPAFYITCNGPAAVPWEEHCSAKYPLSYNRDELEKAAAADGWTTEGRRTFCPSHSLVAPAEKPARKAKATPAADAPVEEEHQ